MKNTYYLTPNSRTGTEKWTVVCVTLSL